MNPASVHREKDNVARLRFVAGLASSPGSLLPPEVNWAKAGGSLGSEIT